MIYEYPYYVVAFSWLFLFCCHAYLIYVTLSNWESNAVILTTMDARVERVGSHIIYETSLSVQLCCLFSSFYTCSVYFAAIVVYNINCHILGCSESSFFLTENLIVHIFSHSISHLTRIINICFEDWYSKACLWKSAIDWTLCLVGALSNIGDERQLR